MQRQTGGLSGPAGAELALARECLLRKPLRCQAHSTLVLALEPDTVPIVCIFLPQLVTPPLHR